MASLSLAPASSRFRTWVSAPGTSETTSNHHPLSRLARAVKSGIPIIPPYFRICPDQRPGPQDLVPETPSFASEPRTRAKVNLVITHSS